MERTIKNKNKKAKIGNVKHGENTESSSIGARKRKPGFHTTMIWNMIYPNILKTRFSVSLN